MNVQVPTMSSMLKRSWWLLMLRGIAAILLGVMTWVQPEASAVVLMVLFGVYVFIDGGLGVFSALKSRGQSRHWWVLLIWGLAGVIVGVMTLVQPAITAWVLTIYIGVWALITGVAEVVAAIRLRKEIDGEWLLILGGVLSVLFGLFVLAQPGSGLLAMMWVLGCYAVIFGVLMVILAFRVRAA